jgi:hypothetical protein
MVLQARSLPEHLNAIELDLTTFVEATAQRIAALRDVAAELTTELQHKEAPTPMLSTPRHGAAGREEGNDAHFILNTDMGGRGGGGEGRGGAIEEMRHPEDSHSPSAAATTAAHSMPIV